MPKILSLIYCLLLYHLVILFAPTFAPTESEFLAAWGLSNAGPSSSTAIHASREPVTEPARADSPKRTLREQMERYGISSTAPSSGIEVDASKEPVTEPARADSPKRSLRETMAWHLS